MLEQQQVPVENQRDSQQSSLEPSSLVVKVVKQEDSAGFILPPQTEALVAGYIASVEDGQQSGTRARLMELTAAYLELDATPEAAAHSAIQQMQNERLAMQKRQASAQQQAFQQRKHTRIAPQSSRHATLTALKIFGGGSLIFVSAPLIMWAILLVVNTPGRFMMDIWMFMCYGLPAMLGVVAGRRASRRPGMGTFYALAMIVPILAVVSELAGRIFALSGSHFIIGSWRLGLLMAVCWLPIGVASAALTGWGRNASDRRRRNAARRAANTAQP